ncbi:MAG: hypothetical protein ACP5RN_12980 [Armatimonadota bacterium]
MTDLAGYDLPFKTHTGYYAGWGRMPVHYIPAGNLWNYWQPIPEPASS